MIAKKIFENIGNVRQWIDWKMIKTLGNNRNFLIGSNALWYVNGYRRDGSVASENNKIDKVVIL